jgi:PAS domain S-box-containing protein
MGSSPPLNLEPPPPAGAGTLELLLSAAPAELLPKLLDAIPARVVVVDRDEKLVWANHEFFVFTGLHPKQVLGASIDRIIGPDAYATYAPTRDRLNRGETVRWEGWTELAGVGLRYMREHLIPVGMENGRPRATIAISDDMTALKQREAELEAKVDQLEATEALKSSIVDTALAAIIATDSAGRIVEFNPAAEAMLGFAREAVLGRPVGDVIVPDRHRAAHHAGMDRMSHGGTPRVMGRRLEMPALRADGTELDVEMVLGRAEVDGEVHYTASLFDLTAQRQAAVQIERQREQLRQSEKLTAMGSLLAGVAHELNNPLAIVMGRASLLEEKTEGTSLAADAARIREAAERCGRIVKTFLNMARARPAERGSVQLNDLVRAAHEMLGYTFRSHGIVLELDLDPQLPEIAADGDQIGQVVLNLLVNAQQSLAATALEDRRVRLSTGLEKRRDAESGRPAREQRVWLRVADNGPGVPDDLRDRLFEPFFTTKPEGIGTGLGLAVSRGIVREHGGDLVIERPNGGACFRVSLPLSGRAEEEAPDTAPAPPDVPARARVLVVDDEDELSDLMRAMLEAAGYEVMTAESGAVAIELLAEATFDAVVSDLRMPDIDGAGLWRSVTERHPQLAQRMLFVTGDTLSPGAQRFLVEARCPSLDKPFSKADLLAAVKALLAQGDSGF